MTDAHNVALHPVVRLQLRTALQDLANHAWIIGELPSNMSVVVAYELVLLNAVVLAIQSQTVDRSTAWLAYVERAAGESARRYMAIHTTRAASLFRSALLIDARAGRYLGRMLGFGS